MQELTKDEWRARVQPVRLEALRESKVSECVSQHISHSPLSFSAHQAATQASVKARREIEDIEQPELSTERENSKLERGPAFDPSADNKCEIELKLSPSADTSAEGMEVLLQV
jgi:hypothetical protein